jgi:hypothetical protein
LWFISLQFSDFSIPLAQDSVPRSNIQENIRLKLWDSQNNISQLAENVD